jgi:hypothetical protein
MKMNWPPGHFGISTESRILFSILLEGAKKSESVGNHETQNKGAKSENTHHTGEVLESSLRSFHGANRTATSLCDFADQSTTNRPLIAFVRRTVAIP